MNLNLNRIISTFTVVASVILALHAVPAKAEVRINFGIYASDKPSEVVKQFKPVLLSLEVSLAKILNESVTIHTHVSPTYEKGIDALVNGRVDFARFGPASYVLAKRESPDIDVLAMESVNGGKIFYGIICVPIDSQITTVSELKGKTFAFGDERSTIGRYLSQWHLQKNNIFANSLKSYEYLGRHDRVGTAVGLGQFDAGALKESTFNKLVSKGVPIRSIARFENVTKPWISSEDIDPEIKAAIKKALLELDDVAALKILKKDGFVEGNDNDYSKIREAMTKNLKFFD